MILCIVASRSELLLVFKLPLHGLAMAVRRLTQGTLKGSLVCPTQAPFQNDDRVAPAQLL